MAIIAWTDVTSLPGSAALSRVDPIAQTAILASVNRFLDVTSFDGEDGPDTHLARANLAAHFCALDQLGRAGGALTLESDGRLQAQYAMPSTRSEYFMTGYGRMVWMLMNVRCKLPVLL